LSSQYIHLRRTYLYASITGVKTLDLIDEESEE